MHMNRRRAIASMHVAALMFGLTGIFGKLTEAGPVAIVLGRAFFAALALLAFARIFSSPILRGINLTRLMQLSACGLLLGVHWLTFFHCENCRSGHRYTRLCQLSSLRRDTGMVDVAGIHQPHGSSESDIDLCWAGARHP